MCWCTYGWASVYVCTLANWQLLWTERGSNIAQPVANMQCPGGLEASANHALSFGEPLDPQLQALLEQQRRQQEQQRLLPPIGAASGFLYTAARPVAQRINNSAINPLERDGELLLLAQALASAAEDDRRGSSGSNSTAITKDSSHKTASIIKRKCKELKTCKALVALPASDAHYVQNIRALVDGVIEEAVRLQVDVPEPISPEIRAEVMNALTSAFRQEEDRLGAQTQAAAVAMVTVRLPLGALIEAVRLKYGPFLKTESGSKRGDEFTPVHDLAMLLESKQSE
jgi:hypothetical protein